MMFMGIIAGIVLVLQIAINAKLGEVLKSPILATFVSCITGSIFLALLLIVKGEGLLIDSHMLLEAPLWIWFAGILGIIYVVASILLFPYLGGVQTAVIPILGQIVMGMVIDHFGWFNSDIKLFGMNRVLGSVLVLSGIMLAIAEFNKLKAGEGISG